MLVLIARALTRARGEPHINACVTTCTEAVYLYCTHVHVYIHMNVRMYDRVYDCVCVFVCLHLSHDLDLSREYGHNKAKDTASDR